MQHVNCNFAKLERVLSKERLCGYKPNHVSQLTQETISLYRWNIVLSELLYPLLHVIEVAFRNSLFNAVAEYVKDPNWLVDNNFLAEGEVQEIKKQVKYLQYKNQLDISHLIAELKFGFWVRLLDRRYEYKQLLWPTLLRTTFPYLDNRKIHLIRSEF